MVSTVFLPAPTFCLLALMNEVKLQKSDIELKIRRQIFNRQIISLIHNNLKIMLELSCLSQRSPWLERVFSELHETFLIWSSLNKMQLMILLLVE